jgi:hypothetical protein
MGPLSDTWPRVEPTKGRLRKYKISREEYWELFNEQGGVCAICKTPGKKKKDGNYQTPAIDHCHDTTRVRGLLCNRCNPPLGFAQDNPKRLVEMLEYMVERNQYKCSERVLQKVQELYTTFEEEGNRKVL